MTGDPRETVLTDTDIVELDILTLLQSREAYAAFEAYAPVITARTAARFADLLRMINRLADGGDFVAAVEAEVFAAVRAPIDVTRLERFGALSTDDPVVKVAALQMLRTIHSNESAESAEGGALAAEGPGDVR